MNPQRSARRAADLFYAELMGLSTGRSARVHVSSKGARRAADLFYAELMGATAPSFAGEAVPAPPVNSVGLMGSVPFDRSRAMLIDVPTETQARMVGSNVILSRITIKVSFAEPQVNHRTAMLYDPHGQYLAGETTNKSSADATTSPFVLSGANLAPAKLLQGRYLVRLVGDKDATHVLYADASFFLWTSEPLSMASQSTLATVKSQPAANSLGRVGAALARSMLLEHQAAVDATGVGTVQGNQCATAPPPGSSPARHDCTTYVLKILEAAFTAKNKAADWTAVFAEAQRLSAGALKGTAVLQALVSKAGWKAVFWSPDPRNPAPNLGKPFDSEAPFAYQKVQSDGVYYGIPVEKAQSVVDYHPTSPTKQESMEQLDKLRMAPLAVIAARGGDHMTLLLHATVYEVHWERPVTDKNVIEATPLEQWGWRSGVVVVPPDDYAAAFRP
jgi:hypothetical protein